jgi:hypothetical protein
MTHFETTYPRPERFSETEWAARVQLAAAYRIPMPVLEKCVRDSLNFDPKFGGGQDAFDALQRIVDRQDPSYRG